MRQYQTMTKYNSPDAELDRRMQANKPKPILSLSLHLTTLPEPALVKISRVGERNLPRVQPQ